MKNVTKPESTRETRRPEILPARDTHAFLPAPRLACLTQLANVFPGAPPSPTPTADTSRPYPSSNRDTERLEFAATRTKQTIELISNRDKKTTSPDAVSRLRILVEKEADA
ncbi:MAG: hypothetical protein WA002_17210, partial [Candidatus Acidiferrales bacterium]